MVPTLSRDPLANWKIGRGDQLFEGPLGSGATIINKGEHAVQLNILYPVNLNELVRINASLDDAEAFIPGLFQAQQGDFRLLTFRESSQARESKRPVDRGPRAERARRSQC